MINILFVCHGNICRSPMAEYLMRHTVKNLGSDKDFLIESRATSTEALGCSVHHGTKKKLSELGIEANEKRAELLKKSDYEKFDYIIGMDSFNIRNIRRILGDDPKEKVYRLLDFTDAPGDISDPWYTGNFDETYDDIIRGIIGFLKMLQEKKIANLWDENKKNGGDKA